MALLKVLERIAILSLYFFFFKPIESDFSLSQSILPILFLQVFLFKVFESCPTNIAKKINHVSLCRTTTLK